MSHYKFEGEVKQIMDLKTFNSGFKKREIIITSDDQYPQDIKFEFLKDDVDMLKSIKANQRVIVSFTLRGNEYNGKFYNNLVAFGITKKKVDKGGKPTEEVVPKVNTTDFPESEDDLPF
jgi:hypothetical protein